MATEEDVANVIFEAATDGTDQLRYVATEDIKPLLAARGEPSEAEYIKFMKEQSDSAVAERQIRSTD